MKNNQTVEVKYIINRGFIDTRINAHVVEVSESFDTWKEAEKCFDSRALDLAKNEYIELIMQEQGNSEEEEYVEYDPIIKYKENIK